MNDNALTTINLELNDFTKDELIMFIQLSDIWGVSINEVFVRMLTEYTNKFEAENDTYSKAIVD